jgi:hypothetical protein
MKEYEKKSKEELLEILYKLGASSTKVKAFESYKRQIDKMIDLLEDLDIATADSLSDSSEKTWDRGRVLFEKLPSYIKDLDDMEASITEVRSKYSKDAEEGTAESFFKKYGEKK